MTRIPSFNDFSPGLIADIRAVLNAVVDHSPDKDKIYKVWADLNFGGVVDKRSTTNTRATLTNTGLLESTTMTLTPIGQAIAGAASKEDAAALLSAHIIMEKNGHLLLKAIVAIRERDEKVTKDQLAKDLRLLGVSLSTGTTDHTTLRNWMVEAGLLTGKNFEPVDDKIKQLTGITTGEAYEWDSPPVSQQIFVQTLRRLAELDADHNVSTKQIYDECLANHSSLFDADQLQKKVVAPLEKS